MLLQTQKHRFSALGVLAMLAAGCLGGLPLAYASSWSPTLLVNTEAFQVIDDSNSSADLYIQFGDSLNKRLTYDRTVGTFIFDDDLEVQGTASGQHIHAQDLLTSSGQTIIEGNQAYDPALLVVDQNSTSGSGQLIDSESTNQAGLMVDMPSINYTDANDLALNPHILFGYNGLFDTNLYRQAADRLKTDDSLWVKETLSGAYIRSFGLTDCDGDTDVIQWDDTTGTFSCGTGGGGGNTGTGALQAFFDNRYVEVGGDTMTGALIINDENPDAKGELQVLGLASGTILHAESLLTSSGGFITEGDLTFGDEVSDTITVNARFASSLIPSTDDTYDLGSSALRWRDVYVGPASLHIGTDDNDAQIGYDTTGNELEFDANDDGTPEVVIEDGGNVGIGTESPGTALEVIGTMSGQLLDLTNSENAEFITLNDSTNGDSVGIFSGTGDPNGSVNGQLGSLFLSSDTGKTWRNNDGATSWSELATASGAHIAKMSRTAAQNIATSTATKIAFDTQEFDIGNIADKDTNDRFDISQAGKYLVTATWRVLDLADGERVRVLIYVNGGVEYENEAISASSANDPTVTVSEILDLNSGDYVEMYVYHTHGTNKNATEARMSVAQLDAGGSASGGGGGGGSEEWTDDGDTLYPTDSITKKVLIGAIGSADTLLEVAGTASGEQLHFGRLLTGSGQFVLEASQAFGPASFFLDHNATTGSGQLIDSESTNQAGLIVDMPQLNYDDANEALNPHILFGYDDVFDTDLYRSGTKTLSTRASFAPANDDAQDLGFDTKRWRTLHVGTASGEHLHFGRLLTGSGNMIIDGTAIFNQDGDADNFRIESDNNENMFFVHGANDMVGIGQSTPEAELDVLGTISGSSLNVGNINGSLSASTGSIMVSQDEGPPEWKAPTSGMMWYVDGSLSTGTSQSAVVIMPYGMTLTDVDLKVKTAPTGSAIIIDINEEGSTIFSTRPEIDASSTREDGNHAFSDTTLAAGSEITIDIDQVGSSTAGSSISIILKGIRHY